LGQVMVKSVAGSIADVDACVLVVQPRYEKPHKQERDHRGASAKGEAASPGMKMMPAEAELIAKIKARHIPAILVINKIDTLPQKEQLLANIALFSAAHDFDAVVPVSALKGDGLDALMAELAKYLELSPHFFDADALTDQPERVLVAEFLREKLLHLLDKEIPHGIAVFTERMAERDNGMLDIELTVFCEKESHKGIIIGKKGALLKKAASQARAEMEAFFGCKVNLQCWVKVKEDWRNRQGLIRDFGLDG